MVFSDVGISEKVINAHSVSAVTLALKKPAVQKPSDVPPEVDKPIPSSWYRSMSDVSWTVWLAIVVGLTCFITIAMTSTLFLGITCGK